MIANLPAGEKQAFFSLLDEYFASRPHRLPASTPASQGGLTDRATAAAGNAAGAAASAAVSNALRDQFARTGLTKGPPPPAPSANKKPGFNVPAGLVSGKVPVAAPASAPAARSLPPPTRTGSSVPAPPSAAPAASAAPVMPPGAIGSATVLYDYGDGTDADDLQATESETVWLTEKISDDWWRAMSQDGARQGIIPTAYHRTAQHRSAMRGGSSAWSHAPALDAVEHTASARMLCFGSPSPPHATAMSDESLDQALCDLCVESCIAVVILVDLQQASRDAGDDIADALDRAFASGSSRRPFRS
ncbi:hypothetical protein PaG_06312 [Moesziomyces aphidis]|uniref:SH3 domain-containing protein n=1 Tax=Moesziomyces aphidis TaxID=84754 RepID=W3VE52_MOEAP|nr:hypothetical protein PaG_06312 [Moesziomyces aphidis]